MIKYINIVILLLIISVIGCKSITKYEGSWTIVKITTNDNKVPQMYGSSLTLTDKGNCVTPWVIGSTGCDCTFEKLSNEIRISACNDFFSGIFTIIEYKKDHKLTLKNENITLECVSAMYFINKRLRELENGF